MTTLTTKSNQCLKALAALVAPVVLSAGLLAASAMPAHAASTFTVNDAGDAPDTDISDGECFAYSLFGFNRCTLRAAIQQANATPGADAINFAVPNSSGSAVKTISPGSALPRITDQVTINGYSQSGASLNTLAKGTNANIMIELDGSGAGVGATGLQIGASGTVVKGLAINRFGGNGIDIDSGAAIKIEGNFIGTDPSGTTAQGNENGVALGSGASGIIVGGTSPEARNLISGNDTNGIFVISSEQNQLLGNLIGTKKGGTEALGNAGDGVDFFGAQDNFVGNGSSAGANTIAFNGGDGVLVRDDTSAFGESLRNLLLRNSIFSNGGLGINLEGGTENAAGATANDPGDADSGPNTLQNKPAVGSAKTGSAGTTIKGNLSSKPSQSYTVRFFSNPSGEDEGKRFIGQKSVTTASDGKVGFTFSPAKKVGVGQTVTATATDSAGNTSEFSAPRTVAAL